MQFRFPVFAAAWFAFVAVASAQNCPPQWNTGEFRLGGPNGKVNVAATFDDGSGPAIYLGGVFTVADGVPSPFLTRLRAGVYEPVGGGISGEVSALAVYDDGSGPALYAGGLFTLAGATPVANLARWDGVSWTSVGGGVVGPVRALLAADLGNGPRLFVGGDFVSAGGTPVGRVAEWNGATFSALGSGVTAAGLASVAALATFTPPGGAISLVAAGSFTQAGGAPAANIARWTGTQWLTLGAGLGGTVAALRSASLGGAAEALYAAGAFGSAGGQPASRIAKFDGASWAPLGTGLGGGVAAALAVHDFGAGPQLVAGGTFVTAGGVAASRIAAYDGLAWSALGPGLSCAACAGGAIVSALLSDGATFYAGGNFAASGADALSCFATYSAGLWSAPQASSGPFGSVLALAAHDDGSGPALFLGGTLSSAGGSAVSRVAKYDGASFAPLGAGVDGTTSALLSYDDGSGPALYAGGAFFNAGGVPASRIAKWSGGTWSALGAGLTGGAEGVLALHGFADASGAALYAGGGFTTAGGAPAANVAKWQNGAWTALGAGATAPGGTVRALASFDDGAGFGARLYAGGDFGVKRWDGATWTVVAAGVNGVCRALVVHADANGPALYAGGAFDVAAGVPGATVKKLGGAGWTNVGVALTGGSVPGVFALVSHDDGSGPKLFAGGQFTHAGFLQVGRCVRFSGVSWAPMGLGVDLPGSSPRGVFALSTYAGPAGQALYAGGDFQFVDAVVSQSLCRWAAAVGYPAFTVNPPAYQKVVEGASFSLTAQATGGQPLNYQWYFNNAALPGENGPVLAVANASYADDGVYTCYAVNGCGAQNSVNARVVVESATLTFSYPGVPNGAAYQLTSTKPFSFYFVAFSLSSANASLPPSGPFFGLGIPTADVVAQFATWSLPFVGVTDAFGSASWTSYPSPLPVGAPYVLYGVAVLFDPTTMTVLGRSERSSYALQ